ncbi:unnamed protein product, partial [Candidula unifasciata]
FDVNSDDDEDDNIYNVVKDVKIGEIDDGKDAEKLVVLEEGKNKRKSSAREKLKLLKYTTRITFDEEGNPDNKDSDDDKGGLNIKQALQRMKEQDKIDKELQRQKIKQQHREKRLKLKEQRRQAELEKRNQDKQKMSRDSDAASEGKSEDEETDNENTSADEEV